MNLFVDSLTDTGINLNIIGLVLICLSAALFLIGLILRMAKLRSGSRVLNFFACLSLVGYTSLFFVDIPGFDLWMVQDYSNLILFIAAVLACIHSLVMVIRKR